MARYLRGAKAPHVHVEVTQKHIDAAKPRDSGHCMIADAIQTKLPAARFISVDLATIRFTDLAAGMRYVYLTPRKAQEALIAWDQGETVEPFQIRLDVAHVLPTGNGRKATASLTDPNHGGTGGIVPVRTGGTSPPLGPLQGGAPIGRRGNAKHGAGPANRKGVRREFGIRRLIK